MGNTGTVEVVDVERHGVRRSAADVLRVAVSSVVLLVVLVIDRFLGSGVVAVSAEVLDGLSRLPEWLQLTLVTVGAVYASGAMLVVTVWAVRRHGWRFLALAVGTVAAAAVVFQVLDLLVQDELAAAAVQLDVRIPVLTGVDAPDPWWAAQIAALAALFAPWAPRRLRRASWVVVFAAALARAVSAPLTFDVPLALAVGWWVGSVVVLATGGPDRRPNGHAVAAALDAVGAPLRRIEAASVDARGSTPYFAEARDGRRLFVKVLGADERSADLLFRAYRAVLPRKLGDGRPFSSLQRAVEHEAFLSLLARDVGVRTPRLIGVASISVDGTEGVDAVVMATEAIAGRSLDRVDPDELTDDVLDGIWAQVVVLRRHRIAHRDLRLANLFRDDAGTAWLIDFGFSEAAASDTLLATDLAELLVSSSMVVGVERAVAAGRRAVGDDGLRAALDRLVPYALSGASRAACKERPGHLDAVRAAVAAP